MTFTCSFRRRGSAQTLLFALAWLPNVAIASSLTLSGTSLQNATLQTPGSAAPDNDADASATYVSNSPDYISLTVGNIVPSGGPCNGTAGAYVTGTGCLYNAFLDTSQILIPSSAVSGGFGTLDNFLANDSGIASYTNTYAGPNAAYFDVELSDGTNTITVNDVSPNDVFNATDRAAFLIDTTSGKQAYEALPGTTTWTIFSAMSLDSISATVNSDATPFGAYTVEGVTIDIGGQESKTEQYADITSITVAGTQVAAVPEPSSLLLLVTAMGALAPFLLGRRRPEA